MIAPANGRFPKVVDSLRESTFRNHHVKERRGDWSSISPLLPEPTEAVVANEEDPANLYRAEDLRTIKTPEHIRQNPGMYVGNVGPRGLHHVVFQLVVNSLTESVAGFGRSVRVTLRSDGSVEIADHGRGLPPEGQLPDQPTRITAFVSMLTGYRANGLERNWYDYAIANALSEWLRVETRHEGHIYRQELQRGEPVAPAQLAGRSPGPGLTVAFKPDPTIFEDTRFSRAEIRDRLRQYAFLHSGVQLILFDETTGNEERFECTDGIRAFVEMLGAGRQPLHPEVLVVRGEEEGVRFEVGLRWYQDDGELCPVRSYVNGEMIPEGGTHVTGMRAALTRSLNDFIHEHLPGGRALTGYQARSVLTAVVSVRMADPLFSGALKTQLSSVEAERTVATGVGQFLRDYFRDHPDVAARIVRAAATRPPSGGPAWTEAEWQSSTNIRALLWFAAERDGRRKAVLFVAAWCAHRERGRKLPRDLEAFADGLLADNTLRRRWQRNPRQRRAIEAVTAADFGPLAADRIACDLTHDHNDPRGPSNLVWHAAQVERCIVQADLIRDIFGNPFRPVTADPAWLTPTALALARGIYADRAFDRLPVLADALQDAGCEHEEILTHCRDPQLTHVRGCWAVDLALGQR